MRRRQGIEKGTRLCVWVVLSLSFLASASVICGQYPSQSQIGKDGTAVLLEDYANLPLSSPTHGGASKSPVNMNGQLGRVTSMCSEPADASMSSTRFFVNDQSGNLYILDKQTKKFTPYLNFAQLFPKFVSDNGNTMGIVSITFDPGYAKNGKFYTVHVEKPDMEGSAVPTNAQVPTLNLRDYATTPAINPPAGPTHLESVLIEWTDANVRNSTFEGTARELLRTGFDRNHPMADLLFNPFVRRGQDDYGNLYISVGDGAQGETPGPGHTLPQQLNALVGKILRITPDTKLRTTDVLGANGRYRIPSSGADPNPFVSVAGARGEIFAYGFRNPHRMTWDTVSNTLLVDDIGLHEWEEIDIVRKGGNYGYAEREGDEQLFVSDAGRTGSLMNPPIPFPEKDRLTVNGLADPVTPLYPAAVYSHLDGDSIANGFVYRGKLMPQLRGKYVFNDMTNGRLFYVDLSEMIATRGERNKHAQIHELQIMYKGPAGNDTSAVKRRMFDIVAEAYARKGGLPAQDRVLPGAAATTTGWKDEEHRQPKTDSDGIAYGGGRADVRMAIGGDAELYVLSKSDGMIRRMIGVVTPSLVSK
jgi:hypothetical protein